VLTWVTTHGPASMTVQGIFFPFSSKILVMPTFLPINPDILIYDLRFFDLPIVNLKSLIIINYLLLKKTGLKYFNPECIFTVFPLRNAPDMFILILYQDL